MSDEEQRGGPPEHVARGRSVTAQADETTVNLGPDPAGPLELCATGAAAVPGQLLAGRYMVLSVLGQGGMGVVVAAYDTRLDRRVALKLLHGERGHGGEGTRSLLEARMVREAQAMARLSHPHVVAVYDTGTLEDGRLFIAMEMVEGQTLRQWYHQRVRTWREVLQAYVAAGRGLEAAHERGMVHRDFKPDNVLVGWDGRVRVTDFGVAQVNAGTTETSTPQELEVLGQRADAWDKSLTLPGTLVGTPRYMAPELLKGQPADARSDLYSFCVALYEALYGQPLFTGHGRAERMRAQQEGRVNAPPAQTQVPAWVGRAVLQGLSADPTQRPASMGELLRALEEDPQAQRRARLRSASLLVAVCGLAALAVVGWMQAQQPACTELEQRLRGVWDEEVKARMRQAMLGTGLSYAQGTYSRVEAVLESYAAQWVRMRTQACEASRAQGEQPQEVAVLTAWCLERRRSQLRELTALLARDGDQRAFLAKAVEAARSLPPLEDCADAEALAAVPLPRDPAVRARVEALQERVDRLEAREQAGHYRSGLELAEGLLREVEAVGYAPLQARALYWVSRLRKGVGDYRRAEEELRLALRTASRAREDKLVALAWSRLVWLVGVEQARHQEALAMELSLEAAVERVEDDRIRALALSNVGSVLLETGRYAEAHERFARAFHLFEKARGGSHPDVARALYNLGEVLSALGRHDEARDYYERAVSLWESTLGHEHPTLGLGLEGLGLLLLETGRHEEAEELLERAVELGSRTLGPEHPQLAGPLLGLGKLRLAQGRPAEALPLLERALALAARKDKAEAQLALARALLAAGKQTQRAEQLRAQARAYYQQLGLEPRREEPGRPTGPRP